MTTTLSGSLVERADAEAFFDAWRERYAAAPSDRDGVVLHDQLLAAAFDTAGSPVPRRRLAMSNAGVPVVYSHKTTRRGGAPRFRLLAEPGGTGITVAEQILLSRDLLARMSRDLGWQRACDQVNAVLDQLIPTDADAVADWHGGLGFGLEIGERGPELRLYCNVRHGDLTSRWQRFADAVGVLAGARV
ncbi:MAG: hypothetical protein ACJ8AD_01380, partial [Gemmatimonadaceae bacterium]